MLTALALAALLLSADQALSPATPPVNDPAVVGGANDAPPASAGLTLDAATRERPNERVCRESARSTFSRIGPARTCRTRIEWARQEGEARRIMDRQQNEAASRSGMPSVSF